MLIRCKKYLDCCEKTPHNRDVFGNRNAHQPFENLAYDLLSSSKIKYWNYRKPLSALQNPKRANSSNLLNVPENLNKHCCTLKHPCQHPNFRCSCPQIILLNAEKFFPVAQTERAQHPGRLNHLKTSGMLASSFSVLAPNPSRLSQSSHLKWMPRRSPTPTNR